MPGSFQTENAVLAIGCLDYLSRHDTNFPTGFNPFNGLDQTSLPGRAELITAGINGHINAPVFLDGAHTINSIKAAASAFAGLFPNKDGTLIFGAVDGKDITGMADILLPLFSNIIISKPGSFKPNNPQSVYEIFANKSSSQHIELLTDPDTALKAALPPGKPIMVTGSFYMVAEIRRLLI